MPYPRRHLVADASRPRTVTAAEDIQELRMLRDAGYIRMELVEVHLPERTTTAVVEEVTSLGLMAIRHLGPSKPAR